MKLTDERINEIIEANTGTFGNKGLIDIKAAIKQALQEQQEATDKEWGEALLTLHPEDMMGVLKQISDLRHK